VSTSVFLKKDYDGNGHNIINSSDLFTFQSGATAVGNGQQMDVSGYATVAVQITFSLTATVTFEGSVDGATYSTVSYVTTNSGSSSTTVTSTNLLRFNVVGLKYFRCRISTYTSGTVDAVGYASTISIPNPAQFASYGGSDSNSASSTSQLVAADNLLFNGTAWERQRSTVAAADSSTGIGQAVTSLTAFNGTFYDRVKMGNADTYTWGVLGTQMMGWSSGSYYQRRRLDDVYGSKYVGIGTFTSATEYTIWTPTSGKKFRLMGLSVCASITGRMFIRDGTGGNFHAMGFAVAGETLTFYFGNGYLSGVVNNSLIIYNGGATGSAWVTTWGTEE
jgi:hypothetical protein